MWSEGIAVLLYLLWISAIDAFDAVYAQQTYWPGYHPSLTSRFIPSRLSHHAQPDPAQILVYSSALNLCQPLHTLKTLRDRIIQDIDIQILHNTNNHADALEEPIDSDAQHAVGSCSVVHLQDILLLVSGEGKRPAYQG
jgi:hypothetical protein